MESATSQSGLDKPLPDRTEAEARAEGHTPTPWKPSLHNGGGETGADIDIESDAKGVAGWFLRLSPGYPFSTFPYPAEVEKEFNANVAFTCLAVSSHDAMKAALLLAQGHIEHMAKWIAAQQGGYSFESLGEDMPSITAALALARGVKP